MRYKHWPYYDEWKDIFEKDWANGEMAGDSGEAWNDVRSTLDFIGDGFNENNYNVNLEDLDDIDVAGESMYAIIAKSTEDRDGKRKKSKAKDKISRVCDILHEIGRKADDRLASLVDSLAYEDRLDKALNGCYDELANISDLIMEDRFEVCGILGSQADKLKIFKGIPSSARLQYVAWLLKTYKK